MSRKEVSAELQGTRGAMLNLRVFGDSLTIQGEYHHFRTKWNDESQRYEEEPVGSFNVLVKVKGEQLFSFMAKKAARSKRGISTLQAGVIKATATRRNE